jgi:hypothetical protein
VFLLEARDSNEGLNERRPKEVQSGKTTRTSSPSSSKAGQAMVFCGFITYFESTKALGRLGRVLGYAFTPEGSPYPRDMLLVPSVAASPAFLTFSLISLL